MTEVNLLTSVGGLVNVAISASSLKGLAMQAWPAVWLAGPNKYI